MRSCAAGRLRPARMVGDGAVRRDLTALAREGLLGPVVALDEEIDQTIDILCRSRSPLLVGEPGVGKTAVAEGLALRLAAADVPAELVGRRLLAVDLRRARGREVEQVVGEARRDGPATILFLEALEALYGFGREEPLEGAQNVLELDTPRVGTTTPGAYCVCAKIDPASWDSFQPVTVSGATVDGAIDILRARNDRRELQVADGAIVAAAELTDRWVPERRLPAKAIEVVDEAAARVLQHVEHEGAGDPRVTAAQIANVVALRRGMLAAHLVEEEPQRQLHLRRRLERRVVSQGDAVAAVVETMLTWRSARAQAPQTSRSMLFVGPRGVGRTELARGIAEIVFGDADRMVRFTGSDVVRLAEAARDLPRTVLLVDAFEEAPPEQLDSLARRLRGGSAFSGSVVILDTTYGAERIQSHTHRMEPFERVEVDLLYMLRAKLPAHLLAVLDRMVVFHALREACLASVAQLHLAHLTQRLHARGIEIDVADGVAADLARRTFDLDLGARPLVGEIGSRIEQELERLLRDGSLAPGDRVRVDERNGAIGIEIAPLLTAPGSGRTE